MLISQKLITTKKCLTGLLLIPFFFMLASASWNLPYQQGTQYDYSQYYDSSLIKSVAIQPDYFKESLAKGWTYYKANYIMSNGLVNHMRLVNNVVTGTNEAVSEGQGYGMILAVLNNDQTTFNTIFEAANKFMWDDNHKSYFIWAWPSGGSGAATDADIDIGLALVFADMLQKRNLWTAYTKTPSYNTRAMDIIRSIRKNMTSSDYLLPGDNWQSNGINSLNPSYFATAWMKVFNSYQTEVSYTAVIDKCYQVLAARSTQYNKGQAPDWTTSSGGTSSQGAPGMGSDAIRTPYRIAMDAMWYNDSRAITFCKNAKNTLTSYTNTTNKKLVLAQMGQYDQNGAIVSSTAGLMKEISMWECAALGSKEPAFSKGCLTGTAIGLIVGDYAFFGDYYKLDQDFYFNQSLGLLGFALISGQFPNIYEDLKNGVPAEVRKSGDAFQEKTLSMQCVRGGFSFSQNAGINRGAITSLSLALYNVKGVKVFSASVKDGSMFIPCSAELSGTGSYVAKVTATYSDKSAPETMTKKIFWK